MKYKSCKNAKLKEGIKNRKAVLVLGIILFATIFITACVSGRYLSSEHERGMAFLAEVKPAEAYKSFQAGLAGAREKNDLNLQVRLLELSGWAKAESLQFLEAQKLLFEARDLAGQNGIDAAVIYARLAVVYAKSGSIEAGKAAAKKGLDLTAERWRAKAGKGASNEQVLDYAMSKPGLPPDEQMLRSTIMPEAALSILHFRAGEMRQTIQWAKRAFFHADKISGMMNMASDEDRRSFYQGLGAAAGAASGASKNLGDIQQSQLYVEKGTDAFKRIGITVKDGDLMKAYIASGNYEKQSQKPTQTGDARYSDEYNRALALFNQGKMNEAEKAFREVAKNAKRQGKNTEAAIVLGRLGWLLAEQGRYAEGIRILEQGIAAAPQAEEAAMSHTRLAVLMSRLGNSAGALAQAEMALNVVVRNRPVLFKGKPQAAVIDAFMKNPGMPPDVLLLKAVLGSETARTVAYYFMGDYMATIKNGKKANAHFEDSKAVMSLAPDVDRRDFYEGAGYSAIVMGDALSLTGQGDLGRRYLQQAQKYFEKIGARFGLNVAKALTSSSYMVEGRYEEGAKIMDALMPQLKKGDFEDILWRTKTRFAYYFERHAMQRANRFKKAIEKHKGTGRTAQMQKVKKDFISRIRSQISNVKVFLGDAQTNKLQQLLNDLEAAKTIPETDRHGERLLRQIKITTYENYKAAISRTESVQAKLETDMNKRAFRADKQLIYDGLIRLSQELFGAAAGLEAVERAKARNLLDLLATKKIAFKHRALAGQEQRVRLKYSQAKQLPVAKNIAENAAAVVAQGENDYRAIVVKIRDQEPELASLIAVEKPAFKKIAKIVPQNGTMLAYYQTPEKLFIFGVSDNRAHVATVDIGKAEMKDKIDAYRRAIGKNDHKASLRLSGLLYDILIAPAKSWIMGNRLLIVPHDVLHYLPFGALYDGRSYLVENFSLVFAPSAGVMAYAQQKARPAKGPVLAFGNPDLGAAKFDLPHAQTESKAVAALFNGSAAYFRGEATETQARTLAGHYDILHFATHGEFSVSDPLYSGLRLARDGQNDGRLTATEIFGMDISPALVVLSACRTGLGVVTAGGEIIGMNRAFIYAGAPAILSSLWSVSDESTSNLMQNFYQNLKYMPKDEALQKAQKDMIGSKNFSRPFYWAAFYLTGAWR
jgi:CHAT domain-containing protein/tetratricopeptide (TPR) repeat protein